MQRSLMNLIYAKKFVKKFAKYTPAIQKQIHRAICNIPMGDIRTIVGQNSPQMYRLRVSKYRVVFYYLDKESVYILKVDSRGDVYK